MEESLKELKAMLEILAENEGELTHKKKGNIMNNENSNSTADDLRAAAELEALKAELAKEKREARWVPSAKLRKTIYTVLAAAVPLSVAYGIFSETEAGLWLAFAGAILSSGGAALAGANTDTH